MPCPPAFQNPLKLKKFDCSGWTGAHSRPFLSCVLVYKRFLIFYFRVFSPADKAFDLKMNNMAQRVFAMAEDPCIRSLFFLHSCGTITT